MTDRRRRPGSDESASWARNLTLGDAQAKFVLRSIVVYVVDTGIAEVSHDTLVADTELSLATVRRKLRWLQEIGLVTLIPRWVDEMGRINHDGRGKQAVGHIRVHTEIDAFDVAMRTDTDKGNTDENTDDSQQPLTQNTDDGETPLKPGEPPPMGVSGSHRLYASEDSEIKKEVRIPPSPPKGGFDEALEKRWQDFKSGYPDGILDLDKAKAAFGGLSDADQAAALAGLPHYADRCKRRREKSIKAHLYVRKRFWEGLGTSPDARPNAGPYDPRSEAGKAIMVLCEMAQYSPIRAGDGRIVWRREITPQLLALASAYGIDKPRLRWPMPGKQFWAWAELLDRAFEGLVRRRLNEISAPWEWPPLKDGTLSPTGPTESTGPPIEPRMTEDDVRELTKGFD
jgi:hypothetical protein